MCAPTSVVGAAGEGVSVTGEGGREKSQHFLDILEEGYKT